jgi:hypothetical protein
MNALLAKQEKFANPLVLSRVGSIEPLSPTKLKVSLDLSGLGAYWKRTVTVQDNLGDNVRVQVNMPVDKMDIFVEYVSMVDMMSNPARYGGFYGWLAYPADIDWVDEAGVVQTVTGMTSMLNREMGCLAIKLCNFEVVEEERKKIPLSEGLAAELGDTAYVIDRDCEPHQRRLTISAMYAQELLNAVVNFGWVHRDTYPAKTDGQYTLVFDVPGCVTPNKCNGLTRLMYYPRIRIPNPNFAVREGQDDNSSTQMTRYYIAAVAGLIAKFNDPAFPSKPGVYASNKAQSEFPIFNERIPSCRTCIFRHFENRSNDAETRMGQSSITVIKTAGVDPVYGCAESGEWLDLVYQAQTEINQQNMEQDIAQPLLQAALDGSACEKYMWSIRYRRRRGMNADEENEDRYPQHTGVYRSWIPASRAIEFIDTLDILTQKFGLGSNISDSEGKHIDYKSALKLWNPNFDWDNAEVGQEVITYLDDVANSLQIHTIEAEDLPHFEARMPYIKVIADNALLEKEDIVDQRECKLAVR